MFPVLITLFVLINVSHGNILPHDNNSRYIDAWLATFIILVKHVKPK